MPKKVEGLEGLLIEDLQDLYDAEKQLVKALPKMAKAASDEELQNAFREHLEVTKAQVQRLEQAFETLDQRAKSKPCAGMKGIIEEGKEIIEEDLEEAILDTAMTAAGRKVEHYEMIGYESARLLALQCGKKEVAQLLQETLQEEIQADKLLTQIGKRLLKEAGSGQQQEKEEKPRSTSGKTQGKTQAKAGQRGSGNNSRGSGRPAQPLTDHEEIRQWAEERGANPACVKGTGGRSDPGMIRLDFPGYSGEDSLEQISWDDWFEKFDENGLALLVQDTTAGGEQSSFNKLVSRESVERKPRTRGAH